MPAGEERLSGQPAGDSAAAQRLGAPQLAVSAAPEARQPWEAGPVPVPRQQAAVLATAAAPPAKPFAIAQSPAGQHQMVSVWPPILKISAEPAAAQPPAAEPAAHATGGGGRPNAAAGVASPAAGGTEGVSLD